MFCACLRDVRVFHRHGSDSFEITNSAGSESLQGELRGRCPGFGKGGDVGSGQSGRKQGLNRET